MCVFDAERVVRRLHRVSLQVLGLQTCVLCYPGEHSRPDLFAIMKREDEVWPTCARKSAV